MDSNNDDNNANGDNITLMDELLDTMNDIRESMNEFQNLLGNQNVVDNYYLWPCTQCTFSNHPLNVSCEMCHLNRFHESYNNIEINDPQVEQQEQQEQQDNRAPGGIIFREYRLFPPNNDNNDNNDNEANDNMIAAGLDQMNPVAALLLLSMFGDGNILNHPMLQGQQNTLADVLNRSFIQDEEKMVPASDTAINNLKEDTITLDDTNCAETCTICYDTYEQNNKIIKLPCEHYFHSECIKRWFVESNNCPLCKFNIEGKESN